MHPRFIVGVDFSEPSEAAMRTAMDYAKAFTGEVHLYHAVHYPGVQSGAQRRDLYEADAAEEATVKLEAIRQKYSAEKIAVTIKVENGNPCHALSKYYAENDGDILFVGTHGYRSSELPFLGSVTLAVLRECTRPVMVVHRAYVSLDGQWSALAPISRSYGIHALIAHFTQCRWPFSVKVDFLHVANPNDDNLQGQRFLERKVQEWADAKLPMGVATMVAHNDVAQAVQTYLDSTVRVYDMLLIESRHHADFGELTLGGTLENIILNSKLPVLCVNDNPA